MEQIETFDIVTGEAVVLEVRPASFGLRMIGAVIDIAVTVSLEAATVLAMAEIANVVDLDPAAWAALTIAATAMYLIVLPVVIETASRGRSLGKLAMGLRIVRDDGGPIRFRHALIRALTGLVEIWMTSGTIALVTSILNNRSKRLGDLLAGTYSARVRGLRTPPPVPMPPELHAWAKAAQIRRLPDGLALRVHQFLYRVNGFAPATRSALGIELASAIEAYVAPPPPRGTHPERFLAAVIAERREREYAALLRRHQSTDARLARARALPFGIADQ